IPAPRRQAAAAGPASHRTPGFATADRLHSAAIHLLRSLRVEDRASGLSAPPLSAPSARVRGGPRAMSALPAPERVPPPPPSRLVAELGRLGLVERPPDPADRRGVK